MSLETIGFLYKPRVAPADSQEKKKKKKSGAFNDIAAKK